MAAETKDKIKNLIKATDLSWKTALVLVNAIYFKADWKYQFDKSKTKEANFYGKAGKKVLSKKVPMMWLREQKFEFAEMASVKCRMLRLPYKGERIVLDILLPNAKENGVPGQYIIPLEVVEKILEKTDILEEFESNKHNISVDVGLPKFKVESTHGVLEEALKANGMNDMWCNGGKSDFSGISSGPGFCVSEV